MNPHKSENIVIALREDLSNNQKLEALFTESEYKAEDDYLARHKLIIEQARRINLMRPVPDGTDRQESRGTKKISEANFSGPRLKIADTPNGDLMLDMFIYSPADESLGRSINMSWYLAECDVPKLIFQEYLSDRNFITGIAAYRPNAPQLLGLIEESIIAYEEAAALQQLPSSEAEQ